MKTAVLKLIYTIVTLLTVSLSVLFVKAISNAQASNIVTEEQVTPSCTPEIEPAEEAYQVILNAEGTVDDNNSNNHMSVEENTTSPLTTDTISPSPTPTNTPRPTNTTKPTTTTAKPTTKVTNTPKPVITAVPTDTPKPTDTPAPYTLRNDSTYLSEVLGGVNYRREEVKVAREIEIDPVVLDSNLNAKAEAHAIKMAIQDEECFHSSYGLIESVRSGTSITGFWEGYAAAGHASQLCTDPTIIKIGVGTAKSQSGKTFTCIIGSRN